MSKKVQNLLFIGFLLLNCFVLNLRTSTKDQNNDPTKSPEVASEKNDEVAGTLFDNIEPIEDELDDDELERKEDGEPQQENIQQLNGEPLQQNNEGEGTQPLTKGGTELENIPSQEQKAKIEEEEERKRKQEEEKKAEEEKKKAEEQKAKEEEEKAKQEAAKESEKLKENAEEEAAIVEAKEIDKLRSQALKDASLFETDPLKKVHHPIFDELSHKSRMWSVGTILVFGSSYLLLKIICGAIKNSSKFLAKSVKHFANQQLLLIILYLISLVLYTEGTLDRIYVSWEYLMAGIAFFIFSWFIFSMIVTIILAVQVNKWEQFEKEGLSFQDLRRQFDPLKNKEYDVERKDEYSETETNKVLEKFDFYALKRFFCLPLFPLFKFTSLRKDLKFSLYLGKCLAHNLRLFYKYSWFSLICFVLVSMFWNVFISANKILTITIVMMIVPLIGVIFIIASAIYLKYKYSQVIGHINQTNMPDFQDIEYNGNLSLDKKAQPTYLRKVLEGNSKLLSNYANSSFFLHNHINDRPPSFYESFFPLGVNFFPIALNLLQTVNLIFISWVIILFGKHLSDIVEAYSKFSYIFLIAGLIIYLSIHIYFTALSLKWFTLLDSIEMKRNEKVLNKVIQLHINEHSEIANDIFNAFKVIYFKMKSSNQKEEYDPLVVDQDFNEKSNELTLTYSHMINLIKYSLSQFKHEDYKNAEINIKEELIPFSKSFAGALTQKEIYFMLRLANLKENQEKLNYQNLCDIYGAILHFRTQKPMEIFKYVFNTHFKKDPNENIQKISDRQVTKFIESYKELFTPEMKEFLKDQCRELGENEGSFSFDSLFGIVNSYRQYQMF
ncbi:MAG: hypothetical protein MJ252_14570 [archaeon]|nr:hypothetical protein [archaeon]